MLRDSRARLDVALARKTGCRLTAVVNIRGNSYRMREHTDLWQSIQEKQSDEASPRRRRKGGSDGLMFVTLNFQPALTLVRFAVMNKHDLTAPRGWAQRLADWMTAIDATDTLARGGALFFPLLFAGVIVHAQTVTVYVDSERPVAKAIDGLTLQYPVVVTYEDPEYLYQGDIREIGDALESDGGRQGSVPAVPRGAFRVEYAVSSRNGEPEDWAATLQAVLDTNERVNGPGRFSIRRVGEVFHVLPVATRGETGQWLAQDSVLDTLVSVSGGSLNLDEMLLEVCSALREATGTAIELGTVRPERSRQSDVAFDSVANEPARDVLINALHSVDRRLTWQMLYEPATRQYSLNVYPVGTRPSESVMPIVDPPSTIAPSPIRHP